jgi:cell division protein FtsI/penicillin-binding protein 2
MWRNRLRKRKTGYIGTWKAYQSVLKQDTHKEEKRRKRSKYLLIILIFLGMIYIISGSPLIGTAYYNSPRKADAASKDKKVSAKDELRRILGARRFTNIASPYVNIKTDDRHLHVKTTIDPELQQSVLNTLNPTAARYMSVVVMNPVNGKILSMVSYDRDNQDNNTCVSNRFPAASIFKIITAAAAIEKCGFNTESEISFIGRKHTLYKSQVKKTGGYNMTLRDSFAQSVNPVFGKIGVHHVGKAALEKYAQFFGFNRVINFDLPLQPSVVYISSDDQFQWAEVASGYNRDTIISPLHGAMIASAIINQGKMVEPILIDEVWDQNGKKLYQSSPKMMGKAVSPYTASVLKNLMGETIESGTCRKSFKDYETDPILSQLNIGGKTGTINSKANDGRRFDWFVGFAEDPASNKKIAISVSIVHEKLIGVKANKYAHEVIRSYFGNYVSKTPVKQLVKAKSSSKLSSKPHHRNISSSYHHKKKKRIGG